MRLLSFLVFSITFTAAILLSSTIAGEIGNPGPSMANRPNPVPIGERPVDGRPIGSPSLENRQTVSDTSTVKDMMAAKHICYKLCNIYNTPRIMIGVSIELQNGGDYATVTALPIVANIWPVSIVQIPDYSKDPCLRSEDGISLDNIQVRVIWKREVWKKGKIHKDFKDQMA
ncbi:hypothetical protein K469DRAFT_753882 [Zopfia rhizophila CBS 207.26]|uniref:Uncharacterized protein n=1 Tax=Zopfia rhizophila CBS 207.26 TaxID=1314779 RepID=A0A6A6DM89_9PEZI|nr:hypothetical protein K469DRAFT_753882 [Zopfia rhizophila CBS 207.26]